MSSGTTLVVLLTVTSAVVCRPATESDVALFLTPLLKDGRVHEAQRLSRVSGGFVKDVVSYAGYITVDDACESHLFFWFFPARNNANTAPVVLWLNGGPGASSLLGAMVENGPFKITPDGEVVTANVSWTDAFSMLYVDNPVGAGYSYTTRSSGLATTMDDIMAHLYSLLLQFFLIYPQFAHNDLYIGGQSYAGKYVPTLGQYIHDHNLDSPPVHLNLKGVYVGCGFCDAATMLPEFPDNLFYTGLISDFTRQSFRSQLMDVINKSLAEGKFDFSDIYKVFSGAANASEYGDIDNILGLKHSLYFVNRALEKFLSSPSTREILHVDLANGKERDLLFNVDVARHLLPLDYFKDTNQQNVFLMENYKVLHYSANLDLKVSVAMTEAFLGQLQWSGADQYRSSVRSKWFSDTAMMGWVTTVGNFTRVVVRNAGHQTPHDQPEAAYLMMTNFVFDRPFNTEMPDSLFDV